MPETQSPFTILEPAALTSLAVFNAPHSGRSYPDSFIASSRLDSITLRRSEDVFVDKLFECCVESGAPLMRAHFPRAYLDVNREPYELDPRMFDGRLPSFANTRSIRVAGGLGTIARIVGESQEIYANRLPVAEAIQRIDAIYKPYHRALRQLLSRTQRQSGAALLIDCHSMPSASLAQESLPKADIVIGDRFGTSCAPAVTAQLEAAFRAEGLLVLRNKPYAGGFITEHYGTPASGLQAVQIEINRSLYVDENSLQPSSEFKHLANAIGRVVGTICSIGLDALSVTRAAAE